MKRSVAILFITFLLLPAFQSFAQSAEKRANTPVPYTLADRDRILNTENKVEMINQKISSLEKSIAIRFDAQGKRFDAQGKRFDAQDKRFDAQDKRFDAIQNQINILFGFLFLILGGVMALIGFVIYDRKTILRPITKRQDNLEKAIIKYSREDKKLREFLQKTGVL
jgi:hypothetical protein